MAQPELQASILKNIAKVNDIERLLQDPSADKRPLYSNFNELIGNMSELQNKAAACQIEVPAELLSFVDRGE
eukprot:CAMPEP_0197849490 /NCGR_PEP_ID=MMETSP1438-20131217/12314_1 /TAXON_ID=1461541 /ORGANISM="Pterosperma sp., Strain CCMP1384" /LENGTH=71 /DNA_ID=CAMNT_0043462211 /DNA_START=104 /DNA_END=316 /DNA_ORIENTATION=+